MEAALKQTVANKQKVDEELTKVLESKLRLEADYHEFCGVVEVNPYTMHVAIYV